MNKFMVFIPITVLSGGCCTTPPHVPFECPERPTFADYSDELFLSLPEQARFNINADDLAMKEYIRACEIRAEIHNEP